MTINLIINQLVIDNSLHVYLKKSSQLKVILSASWSSVNYCQNDISKKKSSKKSKF